MSSDPEAFTVFYGKVIETLKDLRNRAFVSGKIEELVRKVAELTKGLETSPLSFGDPRKKMGEVWVMHRLLSPLDVTYNVHLRHRFVYVQEIKTFPEDAFD